MKLLLSYSVRILLGLVLTQLAVAQSAESICASIKMQATKSNTSLRFRLSNDSDATVQVAKDFSHWQHMYLVVVFERNFGEVVKRTSFSTDPQLGNYEIAPGGYVDEMFALLPAFSSLSKLEGTAVVFWSTDLHVLNSGKECQIRLDGSKRIELPLR
jgi:hypothetical protein